MKNFDEINATLNELQARRKELGSVGSLDFLISQLQAKRDRLNSNDKEVPQTRMQTPKGLDLVTKILLDNSKQTPLAPELRQEYLSQVKSIQSKKSAPAATKEVNPIPREWPRDLKLVPLPEGPNDFHWHQTFREQKKSWPIDGLSVIVPTFNRSKILAITLACLVNQVCDRPFEVIVVDDGSAEDLIKITRQFEEHLDIKVVRQKDYGYQLCAARNLGVRCSKYECIAILDCDMAPGPHWVENYLIALSKSKFVALIGPRKYVDTAPFDMDDFLDNPEFLESIPETRTNNSVANKNQGEISVDWRLEHFKNTEDLRLCDTPFRFFSGGNVALWKHWFDKSGFFDEEFTHWGGEDNEFAYRLFRKGCFFQALHGAMAYHQEPPGKENETDREGGQSITQKLIQEKVPYFYRKLEPLAKAQPKKVPLVSIYVPAYNCQDSIVKCVDSALNQTINDLEVCICDDGSTDDTLHIIETNYGKNPRVNFVSTLNGGIGSASNHAVNLARGFYIGQLDSDDFLEPDAVELCLKEFMSNRHLACVYTTNRNIKPDGTLIADGYNWPLYSREKLTTAMICHHFRMFSSRAWYLTSGFNAQITNAVDYDMYLKLSEIGPFKHINKISYNRVLHGENTSIKKLKQQKENHFKVVNASLKRQQLSDYDYVSTSDSDAARSFAFKKES